MPAQAFAQLNQAQSHHTHDRDGGTPPLGTLPWQSCRPQPGLDRLMILLHHPACGLWQRPCTRRRAVYDFGMTQQEPCQLVLSVWSSDLPDAPGGAWDRGLSAPPLSWTPGSTQRHGGGPHAQGHRARGVWRPLASLSCNLSPGDGAACHSQEASSTLPGLGMTHGTLCGCPDHQAVPQGLPTDPGCVKVRVAIGHPDPLHVWRSVAHALTGWGPDWRRSGASETLLRCCSWPAPWRPHLILLVPSPQHLDWTPLGGVLRGVWPAPTQDSVSQAALEPGGTVAAGAKPRQSRLPRPGQLRRICQ
jgi:hypothetical protein